MSDWISVFDVWKENSPFLRRNLITRNGLFKWTEELGYISSKWEEKEFNILLDYLEEKELFHPIKTAIRGSEFGQWQEKMRGIFYIKIPSEEEMKKIIKYYHPFQFFQIILYWDSFRKFFSEESLFYYYLRKKKLENEELDFKKNKKWMKKIQNEEINWIKKTNKKMYKSFNKGVDLSEKYTRKQKREKKRKNKRDSKFDNNQNRVLFDQFYPKLTGSFWLNSDFLKVWIKIDSLMLFRNRIITPGIVRIEPKLNTISRYDKTEKKLVLKNYNSWRDSLMANKKEFLSDEEKETLKAMYNEIYRFFIHSSKNMIGGLEKWGDLLEMISANKLGELYGNLNISINIILLLKSFTRIAWELFGINLLPWPKNKEKEQPYLYFKDDSEVIDFRKSVLADFGLFASTPFILYTEGRTEKTLMKYYYEKKWLLFPISVESIRGIDKAIQALTINRPLKDRIYFFFLDYENPQKHKTKKEEIRDHGAFFFPDFVTENFEPDEILDLYDKWINNLGTTLIESQRKSLLSNLKKSKNDSNRLIESEDKTLNIKGYEKILIDFSLNNFKKIFMEAYPDIVFGGDHSYLNKKKFKQTFKKIFTEEYLILPIKEKLEEDPERKNDLFPFEVKLKPFYDAINRYRLRNDIIQYDLKI